MRAPIVHDGCQVSPGEKHRTDLSVIQSSPHDARVRQMGRGCLLGSRTNKAESGGVSSRSVPRDRNDICLMAHARPGGGMIGRQGAGTRGSVLVIRDRASELTSHRDIR